MERELNQAASEEFTTIISLISGELDRISQLIRKSPHEENKERLASVAHLDTISYQN